ncbi:MAG: ribosomal protein L7/L12 [Myxococcales bacterium]|nr:ribosomal protein L7/L12 [Myxococcales bacterium]
MRVSRDQVIAYLSALSPAALRELIVELEERWGVERLQLAPPSTAVVEGTMGMPRGFDVVLLEVGADARISVMKGLRALLGVELKEAKTLVDGCPARVAEDLDRETASVMLEALSEAGARVELR